ncbi:hypothetical protein [Streptosporangium pseudovulgare]|uniref:Uncharacterized protein n=1 Tax=Streptosporangium pseudovulgare TaxID=35765 RepID=A0ABQ2RI21_9ACTN|nr:hypothetical protein [Streptosporangium pseudovulgare]GGQ32164.1 hypothetical protein GCM10010140_72830 [Streptosporangium pseudovulgare]
MSVRLRRTLAACTTLLAFAAFPATAGTAAAAPPHAAAQRAASGLPPVGAKIPCTMLAVGSSLRIGTEQLTVDFRGGKMQRVEPNQDDPVRSVRMQTLGFRVAADLPDGGTAVIELDGEDRDAASTLTLIQSFPPRYRQVDVIPVKLTITRPDQAPIVLTARRPLVYEAELTQYPPRGDQYRLREPLDFLNADGTTQATLETYPAKVGGL